MISELTPEQRWIFIGLLLLAGDSEVPGTVFQRKDEGGALLGFRSAILADHLGVPDESINPALTRMIEKGKIEVNVLRVITISNWSKYQSDYERTREAPSRRTKVQPPEEQKYRLDLDLDGDLEEEKEKGPGKPAPCASSLLPIFDQWNRFAKGHELAQIQAIPKGSARERTLKARLKEGMAFEDVLKAIHMQPFLYGDNDRGWLVNFDWILKPANLAKILEGAYVKDVRGAARDKAPDDPKVGGRR
jgi:hypothetical protein